MSPRSGTPLPINRAPGSSSQYSQAGKNKGHRDWKGGSETVFIDRNVILYVENLKESAHKLLGLINEFCRVTRSQINIPSSILFLYINNEQPEIDIEIIPLAMASKRTNTQEYIEEKNFEACTENYTILL